jgi:hypothetical protein
MSCQVSLVVVESVTCEGQSAFGGFRKRDANSAYREGW